MISSFVPAVSLVLSVCTSCRAAVVDPYHVLLKKSERTCKFNSLSAPVLYCGAWVYYSCGSTTVAFCEEVTVCLKDFFTPLQLQFSKCSLFFR